MSDTFDAIILTVPNDLMRTQKLYYKIAQNLPVQKIHIIGSSEVGKLLPSLGLDEKFDFIEEESLIPFHDVKRIIESRFPGKTISRGMVGWYYQQFLKLKYADICPDAYYLSWDGDTIPVRPIEMFQSDIPYMDWKREYCPIYFRTISSLFPGFHKVIEPSFIAEHMLFSKEYVQSMCAEIMSAGHLTGDTFYERILRAISLEDLNGTGFSEFETYGTFIAYRNPGLYRLRRWTSFRNCGQYFSPDTITEKELVWLSKDFHALSFEKNQIPATENNVFQNPTFQEKFSARYILELIQEEMTEGYRETWD